MKTTKETNNRRAAYKRAVINRYKQMKGCIDCGYKVNGMALEFDHVDETTKSRTVGSLMYNSFKDLKNEIKKCVIRCSNCHMIRTRTRNYRKNMGS